MDRPVEVSRRAVVGGALAGAGLLAVSACGGGDDGSEAASGSSSSPTSSGTASPEGGDAGSATVVAAVADVPVGSAVAAEDADGKPILVAQPREGEVVAFSAICTHMGCTVAPAGDELKCPCHGSVYDAATGEVLHGPAPRALPAVPVHVADGQVVLGA